MLRFTNSIAEIAKRGKDSACSKKLTICLKNTT